MKLRATDWLSGEADAGCGGKFNERLHRASSLSRDDRPDTLFYLDPPYHGSHDFYGKEMFPIDQFESLAAALKRLKGAFLVSLNDCPEVRRIFASFAIEALPVRYSVSGGAGIEAGEVLIRRKNEGRYASFK